MVRKPGYLKYNLYGQIRACEWSKRMCSRNENINTLSFDLHAVKSEVGDLLHWQMLLRHLHQSLIPRHKIATDCKIHFWLHLITRQFLLIWKKGPTKLQKIMK